MSWQKHVTNRVVVERVRIVGPFDEGSKTMDAMHAEGFRMVRSGPYVSNNKCDFDRFLFIAEREIQEAKP